MPYTGAGGEEDKPVWEGRGAGWGNSLYKQIDESMDGVDQRREVGS
jgi:hypothetical protein